jgi:hypothetical protein
MEDLQRFASSTELAVSRASSGSTPSDSEESKDVRRPYAACERYGFESFGRINKCVVKVLTCSRASSPGTSITFRNARRWMSVSGSPLCASSTAHAHSLTRTRHGCACSGGGGFDKISRTASAALRRTFGRGSIACSTRVLNALRTPGASSECESSEEMKAPKIVMRDRREGAWGFVCGRRGARMGRRVEDWDRRRAGEDEMDDYCNEVECRWEDVTLVEGRFVAGEGALKGRNECCKVGRGRRSCSCSCSCGCI